ncbi:hypothetical protein ACFP81_10800 [Deinococcus lacus]|uniref:DUF4878 domain-containing protein n=1 Tax=Deinococcus lacus TaxID=392561 RepID=A0ABW1YFX8_9DEIO
MRKVILASLLLGLTSCGSSPTPATAARDFLQALQSFDIPRATSYMHSDASISLVETAMDEPYTSAVRKALWNRMTFEIPEVAASDQKETKVPAKIKIVDMASVGDKIIAQKDMSPEFIVDQINSPSADMREETIVFLMKNEGDSWKIANSEDFELEKLLGGLGGL